MTRRKRFVLTPKARADPIEIWSNIERARQSRHNDGGTLEAMATVTEIGSLISRRPNVRGGRPCVAGTGVSVRRIAQWHNMGLIPEEIARKVGHLSLAQVHAALAWYRANQVEIDTDLQTEAREAEALERQHRG